MSTESRELQSNFIILDCESPWTGALSHVLTDCTRKTDIGKICRSVAREIKRDTGTEIEFAWHTLKEVLTEMEESCVLGEISDGEHDGFDDVDPSLLTQEKLLLPENAALLHDVLKLHFNTGYVAGIIVNYLRARGVNVIMASED